MRILGLLFLLVSNLLIAQNVDLSTFRWRAIGPSFMSGRIVDLAVHPKTNSVYYVGVAAGGVFKTTNGGTTYDPIFENYGSYSIGCVTIDPENHNVVWVGTGEANNQRSVGYGDGIYKSEDGGKSFVNMGLKSSDHIGEIIIDPTNTDIIYVAAYGPLWDSGGERGVYKSIDGGKTWTQSLKVSDHTGVADIVMDPKNSKTLYASAHQRQRKGYGYVSGGPESALYKSTDAGATWKKINKGFPSGDIGRIAVAISPMNSDVLYAHLEAQDGQNGSYKSSDRGASWQKLSDYSSSGLYYGKIFPDPIQFDKLYIGDVFSKYTTDGGKTYQNITANNVHVDNHVFWIDPKDNKHWMLGGDGGLYETFNEGGNWHFKENLSITQFYRVATDNAFPFYNVYGGTQDNSSMGGPARTTNIAGIPNSEWYITQGGDGFESQADWQNPNIIYAQAQHGWLARYDKRTGENVQIKPIELEGEPALRWNWDAPLLVSSFDSKRLYFGANKVYRSDDRGDSWQLISPDLSRQIDRNKLPYMGKVWSVDAVQKNTSTSIFGQTTSLSESRIDEKILWAGTDDGLVHLTVDGGKTWSKFDNLPGVPKMSYVPQVIASGHDKNTAYVVFNHHRYGDYKPYLLRTRDAGKTWQMIVNTLPTRGSLYTIVEDHVDPNLLFVGSDFGVFVSTDGGEKWQALKSGLPVICIKDMEIQRRENDLVIATFGRGFYVLDDYSNLRELAKDKEKANKIYPIKSQWLFNNSSPLGGGRRDKFGTQGDTYWAGDNPPVGAVIRYQVKDVPTSIKQKRKKYEKEQIEKGTLAGYPSLDSLRMEDNEIMPFYFLNIYDQSGTLIKRVKQSPSTGINKYVWDGKLSNTTSLSPSGRGGDNGYPVMPGKFAVDLSFFDGEKTQVITNRESFELKSLGMASLPIKDAEGLKSFAQECTEFSKVLNCTDDYVGVLNNKLKSLRSGVLALTKADMNLNSQLNQVEKMLQSIKLQLEGDNSLENRQFEALPGIMSRASTAMWSIYGFSSDVPGIQKQSLALAKKQLKPVYDDVKKVDTILDTVAKALQSAGGPSLPGTLPLWDGK